MTKIAPVTINGRRYYVWWNPVARRLEYKDVLKAKLRRVKRLREKGRTE